MSRPIGIERPTKYCELTVHLVTGIRIEGMFHIVAETSSAVRPSDAIRDCKGGFLILTNATIHEPTGPRKQDSIMVRADAVSHIDLPAKGWTAKEPVDLGPFLAVAGQECAQPPVS
jgi:hypothetical protein